MGRTSQGQSTPLEVVALCCDRHQHAGTPQDAPGKEWHFWEPDADRPRIVLAQGPTTNPAAIAAAAYPWFLQIGAYYTQILPYDLNRITFSYTDGRLYLLFGLAVSKNHWPDGRLPIDVSIAIGEIVHPRGRLPGGPAEQRLWRFAEGVKTLDRLYRTLETTHFDSEDARTSQDSLLASIAEARAEMAEMGLDDIQVDLALSLYRKTMRYPDTLWDAVQALH